jgi:WD40 repeat protein/uncharacterized caspase-like protein
MDWVSPQVTSRLTGLILSYLFASYFSPICQAGELPPAMVETMPSLIVQVGQLNCTCVAMTSDGRLALTGSIDKTVKLWDLKSGRLIRTLNGHSQAVNSVAITPDGQRGLTGSDDKTAMYWDLENGTMICTLRGHEEGIRSVAITPDGRRAMTGSNDNTAKLWDLKSGRQLYTFRGHSKEVNAVAVTPDGRRALTGSYDRTTKVWDLESGRLLCTLQGSPDRFPEGHGDGVLAVAVTADCRRALTGSYDWAARLWDIESGRLVHTLRGHRDWVNSVAVTRDGRRALTGSNDKTAKLWDLDSGRLLHTLKGHDGLVLAVAMTGDGRLALTGSNDGTAKLWNLESVQPIVTLRGYDTWVKSIDIAPDGRRILIGSYDKTAKLWDLESGRQIQMLVGHSQAVTSVAILPGGHRAITGSLDGTAKLWDMESGQVIRSFEGHSQKIDSVAVTPDGHRALTGSMDLTAKLWDLDSGQLIQTYPHMDGWVTSVAFTPNGRSALTGCSDRVARLWDLESHQATQALRGHHDWVTSVAMTPDGRRAVTGSSDKTAKVWDLGSGKPLRTLEGHASSVLAVAVTPDGRRAVTGSNDRTAKVWDLESGQLLGTLEGHGDRILAVKITPDGQYALTGSSDRTVGVWELASYRNLCQLISFQDGTWTTVDPNHRFDTSQLEIISGFQWVFRDDPFRPLPPEIFLRDYYEPRLLPRLLDPRERGRLPPVRPLADLNRVQPAVQILECKPGDQPDEALVTLEASQAEGPFHRAGKEVVMRTTVFDLRLFRDGQLVGQWPEPGQEALDADPTSQEQMNAWRRASRVDLSTAGKATRSFHVRLPHRDGPGPVEFSAYAFNEDRVKSETARLVYQAPAHPSSQRPRAYLLCMGVSACQSSRWDLRFAHKDAELMASALGGALQAAGHYEVVPVVLTSAYDPQGKLGSTSATKDNLKTALQLLAGQKVDAKAKEQLPHIDQLQRATPDDLVLVSFSGHGYTDPRGVLYLVPYDVGNPQTDIQAVLLRCLSTMELASWLREVDAGELTMIVDCCHAGALPGPGFKPGPLGSRGLWQLAYDKGMRVLAASQAADVAVETGGKIQQGLLTYALVRDGLEQRRAAQDEKLTLAGLLAYAVQRVPGLYAEVLRGEIKDARGLKARDVGAVRPTDPAQSWAQRPELFDYAKKRPDVRLASGPQGP